MINMGATTSRSCPLCKKNLITKVPVPPDRIYRLICGTHIADSKLSHYYIEVGQNNVEVIHVPPFSLINNSGNDMTDVYPLNVDSCAGISLQKKVCSVPRFGIGDPNRLADRVKLFVLFS
jgi:hypothetical protein